jgi:membrane-associated phospholipid phosphatase
LTGDAKLAGFGRDAAGSLLVSTVLVSGLKVSVGRTRPNGGERGFPSGHSITAFCFAPVVEAYWGWEAALPAYGLAVLTGLARIEGDNHYLSDVIAGATLGVLVGRTMARPPEGFSFTAGPGTVGIGYSFD